jgi:hypothetical protein
MPVEVLKNGMSFAGDALRDGMMNSNPDRLVHEPCSSGMPFRHTFIAVL